MRDLFFYFGGFITFEKVDKAIIWPADGENTSRV